MVTTYPIGFISYNSHDYLKYVLEKLIADGVFSRCACWFHESLEEDKKDHFHCWCEPSVKLDTETLQSKFVETLEDGSQVSIAIKPKCKSDWNNAYLYGIHDSDYLDYKNIVREQVNIITDRHIYLGDFKADFVQAEYFRFNTCLAPYARIRELVERGYSLEDCYLKLRIPFAQLYTVKQAYVFISNHLRISAERDLIEINDKSPFNDQKRGD